MHRSPTPLHQLLSGCPPAVHIALKLSGTMTVLCLLGLSRPAPVEAQTIGTMQVVARVTPAAAAWAGLSGAQQIARAFGTTPNAGTPRRLDSSLARVQLEFPSRTLPSDPSQPAISIQYLRN